MHSPEEHYAEADRLLEELHGETHHADLAHVAFRLALAQLHAQLAQCAYMLDNFDRYDFDFAAREIVTPPVKEGIL
jgi:hypothetical protein